MLNLYVIYTTKPSMRQEFLNALHDSGILEIIRNEDGCMMYELSLSDSNENELLLIERWTEPAYQQMHMQQEHMKRFREIKNRFVDASVLGRYEDISE